MGELGSNTRPLDSVGLGLHLRALLTAALVSQSPGGDACLDTAGQVWEYREGRTRPAWKRRVCCLGKLCSGWCPRVLCVSFKNDYCFFFHKGTSIFAKERGKLFQLKQDKTFQAGVILASHFQSVFLPSVGWLSWNMGSEGAMPLPPLLIPVLATLILHFFLELPARTWETFPPTCMIFRSGTHSLFFILFSNKGSDIPISQSGSLVAVLSQAWRAWDPDHWLKWSLRNVSEVLIAVPYPSFSTPALGEKKTCIKGPLWVRHWRQSL